MFQIRECGIKDCYELLPKVIEDNRGRFVKIYHSEAFEKLGLSVEFKEEYYSTSQRDVIRGMHFQMPPHDHIKMVYCTTGEVLDVLLDLRVGSPTFGRVATICISHDKGNFIYMPRGIAHGFCVLSEKATLVYKVGSVYCREADSGVLWSSIGLEWPTEKPIVSERDQAFMALPDFESPFVYNSR